MKKFLLYLLGAIGLVGCYLGGNFLWNVKIDSRVHKALVSFMENLPIGFSNKTSAPALNLALTNVATSTLTAAQICGTTFLSIAPVSTTPTITGPSSSTLFSGCLAAIGASWDVNYQALNTSTILAAGAGGTIINSSASTIAANKGAILRFVRDTNTTYKIYLINLLN